VEGGGHEEEGARGKGERLGEARKAEGAALEVRSGGEGRGQEGLRRVERGADGPQKVGSEGHPGRAGGRSRGEEVVEEAEGERSVARREVGREGEEAKTTKPGWAGQEGERD
jgi:hypothetical protein